MTRTRCTYSPASRMEIRMAGQCVLSRGEGFRECLERAPQGPNEARRGGKRVPLRQNMKGLLRDRRPPSREAVARGEPITGL